MCASKKELVADAHMIMKLKKKLTVDLVRIGRVATEQHLRILHCMVDRA